MALLKSLFCLKLTSNYINKMQKFDKELLIKCIARREEQNIKKKCTKKVNYSNYAHKQHVMRIALI